MGPLIRFRGLPIVIAAPVRGRALVSDVPLSFWGGFDPDSGEIIDQRHPLAGQMARGRVLVIPTGRGSCSGSGVLLEAVRNGVAPLAILTSRVDPIISLGAILGDELCGTHPATVVIGDEERTQIATDDLVSIDREGWITVTPEDRANVTRSPLD